MERRWDDPVWLAPVAVSLREWRLAFLRLSNMGAKNSRKGSSQIYYLGGKEPVSQSRSQSLSHPHQRSFVVRGIASNAKITGLVQMSQISPQEQT